MKRYLVFALFARPHGGWEDLMEDFATVEEAEEAIKDAHRRTKFYSYHIVDLKQGKIVKKLSASDVQERLMDEWKGYLARTDQQEGWTRPSKIEEVRGRKIKARTLHYCIEGRSLCGDWKLSGDERFIKPEDLAATHLPLCKKCERALIKRMKAGKGA